MEDPDVDRRPDIAAAIRGGDPLQPMDGEDNLGTASLEQARYWQRTYREILTMEERVLQRIRELMALETEQVRREVERSNVPIVVAQAERFRARLEFWNARGREIESG